jgi:DNA-binding transcriptional MerR regulator
VPHQPVIARLLPYSGYIGLAAALLIALAWGARVNSLRADYKEELDQYALEIADWRDKHAILGLSIADLQAVINDQNAQTEARAAQFAAQAEENANRLAQLDRQATTSRQRIAKLQAIAQQSPSVCGVDEELRKALAGI